MDDKQSETEEVDSNTVKLVKDIEEEKEPESEPELTEGIVKTESEVVSEPVTDEEPTSEPVAVVTEEKECETLIVTPIKLWTENDSGDVKDLEDFLNAFEWESLEVDGIYWESDFEAVKRFQLKYASDILTPWDIKAPTWYVYKTTTKKINEVYCSQ